MFMPRRAVGLSRLKMVTNSSRCGASVSDRPVSDQHANRSIDGAHVAQAQRFTDDSANLSSARVLSYSLRITFMAVPLRPASQ